MQRRVLQVLAHRLSWQDEGAEEHSAYGIGNGRERKCSYSYQYCREGALMAERA